MPNSEVIKALAETSQGIKNLVGAVSDEMRSRQNREAQESRREEKIEATGEETYKVVICTRRPTDHYFTPEGVLPHWTGCPVCEGYLRTVEMVIVNP